MIASFRKRHRPPAINSLLLFAVQITRIKEKVEEQSGVPPPQQRLIFGGRQMYVDLLAIRYSFQILTPLFTCTCKRVQARRQDRTRVQHYSRRCPPSRPRAPRWQIDDDDPPVPHVKLHESFVISTREGGEGQESGIMICSQLAIIASYVD